MLCYQDDELNQFMKTHAVKRAEKTGTTLRPQEALREKSGRKEMTHDEMAKVMDSGCLSVCHILPDHLVHTNSLHFTVFEDPPLLSLKIVALFSVGDRYGTLQLTEPPPTF